MPLFGIFGIVIKMVATNEKNKIKKHKYEKKYLILHLKYGSSIKGMYFAML